MIIIDFLKSLFKIFSGFTPSPTFLSDIAAFEAVVIGLAIPLSFEIVSRISERYQSDAISKRFIREWPIRLLPVLLVFNIIFAVALRFTFNTPTSIEWKFFAWIAFAVFLIIALFFLFSFIPKLISYMTDHEFVLERLFDEAEKSLQE